MTRAISPLILSALLPPALAALVVSSLLISVGTLASLLLSQGAGLGAAPPPDLLPALALASVGASPGVALPASLLVGAMAGLRRLHDEGAWLALRCAGLSGLQLAARLAALTAPALALHLAALHLAEPLARSDLRALRVAAALRVQPLPGHTLRLGPWSLSPDPADPAAPAAPTLRFAGTLSGQPCLGRARRWSLRPAQDGVLLDLRDGELYTALDPAPPAPPAPRSPAPRSPAPRSPADPPAPLALRFDALRLPVPLPGLTRQTHANERPTPDLLARLRAAEGSGLPPERTAYERWILNKRTLLPLAHWLLGLAAPPLALSRRPLWPAALAMLLSLWALTRLLDRNVAALGQPAAAALLLLGAAAWLLPWARWPDR